MAKTKKLTVVGFVYPAELAESSSPKTFGAMPGVWTPGHVHLAEEFGLADDDLRGFIEQGYPIREVEVEAADEKGLEKALSTARVDEVTAEGVEGTPTAEKTVSVPDDEE